MLSAMKNGSTTTVQVIKEDDQLAMGARHALTRICFSASGGIVMDFCSEYLKSRQALNSAIYSNMQIKDHDVICEKLRNNFRMNVFTFIKITLGHMIVQ